jgi:hypothetical protein
MTLHDSTLIHCPYCGESNEMELDNSISKQQYVEDCQVCCQAIVFQVIVDDRGDPIVNVRKEND